MNVDRVAVANIAVRIEVSGLEHHPSRGIGHGHVKPDDPLGVESRGHVVPAGAVPELHLEGNTARVRPVDRHVAELIAGPQQLQALSSDLIQQIEVVANDVRGVVPVVRLHPTGRKLVIIRRRVLESVSTPPRLVVEHQPFAQRRQLLRLGIVGENAGMDDRIVRAREHMIGSFPRSGRPVPHARSRTRRVPRRNARFRSHMAVLTARSVPRRRRVLVLAERFFQPKPVDQIDIMTRPAQSRPRKLEELPRLGVNGSARTLRVRLQIEFAALDRALQLVVAARPEHRVVQAALDQRQPSADLPQRLILTMADDAGNSFTRGRMPIEVRHEGRFFQVHPHRGVTTNAEVTVGAVRQLGNLRMHRVEDGTELCVGVGRDRPFAIYVLMARGAGCR